MLQWLQREGLLLPCFPFPLSAVTTSTEKMRCKGGVSVKFCLQKFTDAPFTSHSLHGLVCDCFACTMFARASTSEHNSKSCILGKISTARARMLKSKFPKKKMNFGELF